MSYPLYGAAHPGPRPHKRGPIFGMPSPVILGLVIVAIVVATIWTSDRFRSPSKSNVVERVELPVLKSGILDASADFTLARSAYGPLPYFAKTYSSNFLNYEFLKPYDAVIEPYQPMELAFYDRDVSEGNYRFVVCSSGSTEDCQEGYSMTTDSTTTSKGVKFSCTARSTFDITVYTLGSDGNVVAQQKGSAICLYVRREWRTLTSSDLNAFLDASYTVYSLTEEEGAKRYGKDFHNSTYLTRFHHFNAAQQDGDHIHEGLGFLTQHLRLTNMFDDAVRVVDPTQSMPYWEFTQDSEAGARSWDTAIMTSTSYGDIQLPVNYSHGFQYSTDKIVDARIKNGRWKDLKVEMNYYYPELDYGYGYMRAPWNMNPSPYISRFAFDFGGMVTLPSCESHYEALQFDDMMDFFYWSAFTPHAETHTLFGGIYGCDKFFTLVEKGYILSDNEARAVCSNWPFFLKEFWRSNYITARKDCKVSDTMENSFCGFECKPESYNAMISFLFPQIQMFTNLEDYSGASAAFVDFICNDAGKVFTGDHLESASPADPSFWVIHTTLERLYHAKLMSGGFESETWRTDAKNDFVCEKSYCYSSTYGKSDYYDDCCQGHYENDQMMDAIAGDRKQGFGMSNKETVAATDPRSSEYSMSYIYDKFEWDHCTDSKYDFLGLLNDLRDEYEARTGKKTDNAKAVSKGKRPMTNQQKKIKARQAMLLSFNTFHENASKQITEAKRLAAAMKEGSPAATPQQVSNK